MGDTGARQAHRLPGAYLSYEPAGRSTHPETPELRSASRTRRALTLPGVAGEHARHSTSRRSPSGSTTASKEHEAFLKFIKGIPDDDLQRWYASVMLNRLMFIYFIQQKGFLDGDQDYLRNKLAESKRTRQGPVSTAISSVRCSLRGSQNAQTERSPTLEQAAWQRPLSQRRPVPASTRSKNCTAGHPHSRQRIREDIRFLRAVPLAPRRTAAAQRQRDQS